MTTTHDLVLGIDFGTDSWYRSGGFEMEYKPNPKNAAAYDRIYGKYLALGNFIEKQTREESK